MLFCWIGYHRKLKWGVNPVNDNTEPECLDCGHFIQKTPWLKIGRFQ